MGSGEEITPELGDSVERDLCSTISEEEERVVEAEVVETSKKAGFSSGKGEVAKYIAKIRVINKEIIENLK